MIIYFIVGLFLLDMYLTFKYIESYKNKFPKNDWTLAEANPIIRYFIKARGLQEGMVYATFTIGVLLLGIIVISTNNFLWFLSGMYFMVNVHHFVNWQAIKRMKVKK